MGKIAKTNTLLARRKVAITLGIEHAHPLFARRAENADIIGSVL
jgi:hypothetical protein